MNDVSKWLWAHPNNSEFINHITNKPMIFFHHLLASTVTVKVHFHACKGAEDFFLNGHTATDMRFSAK